MIAGQLEVVMLANLARLSDDMNKAKGIVGGAVKSIEGMAATAAKALGAIGVAFSGAVLLDKINSVVEGMAKLQNESEKTGASIENLSKLQFFAAASGTNIEGVNSALVKLSKSMSESSVDSKKAAQAFAFLGISAKDAAGNLKDPSELFGEISRKLIDYKDGAGKAAIAQALFGKAGAEMLPVLKKMAELGEVEATVTKQQAAAAEAYEIEVIKLRREKETLWNLVVASMLPSMKSFVEVLLEASKQTGSLGSAVKGFAADKSFENWTDAAIMGLARLIDVIKTIPPLLSALGGSFQTVWADIMVAGKFANLANPLTNAGLRAAGRDPVEELKAEVDKRNKVLADASKKYSDLWNMPGNQMEQSMAANIAARKKREALEAIYGPPGGAGGGKNLNFQLTDTAGQNAIQKAYREYIKERAKIELDEFKDVAAHKQTMLDMAYQDNRVSDEAYFRGKLEIAKNTAEQEISVIDELRDAQYAAVQKAKVGTAEWWKALKDVEATEANRAKIIRDFGQLAEVTFAQAAKAAREYARSVESIDAQILALKGDLAGAAKIQFDLQNEQNVKKFTAAGDTSALRKLAEQRELTAAQADFNQKRTELSDLNAYLQIQEERIQNSQRTGAISELESLERTGNARRQALDQMQKTVEALQRIAVASQNPALILQAEQAVAALEKLRTETDLVAQKFETIFTSSFSSAFSDFITGAKTARQAFDSFANSVIKRLADLYAEALAKNIWRAMGMGDAVSGTGGVASGFFRWLLGGGSSAGSASVSYGGEMLGQFATGTDYVPQTGMYQLHKGEAVIPAGENGGVTFNMPVTIHAEGADIGAVQRIEAGLVRLERSIVPKIMDAKRRNAFGNVL